MEVLPLSSSRSVSVCKQTLQFYLLARLLLCRGRRTSPTNTGDSDAKCNDVVREQLCCRLQPAVATQFLRIQFPHGTAQMCVSHVSVFSKLLLVIYGQLADTAPPVPTNACKARHVEALKYVHCNTPNYLANLVLHIFHFADISAVTCYTLCEVVPASLCLSQLLLGQQ